MFAEWNSVTILDSELTTPTSEHHLVTTGNIVMLAHMTCSSYKLLTMAAKLPQK